MASVQTQGPLGATTLTRSAELRLETVIQGLVAIATGFLVLYPLLWILLASFRTSLFESELTTKWYRQAFSDPRTYAALRDTLAFATGGTVLAVVIGITLAWLVTRTDMPLKGLVRIAAVLPFISTAMITAISWSLLAFPRTGILNLLLRSLFGLDVEQGPLNIFTMGGMIWVLGIYLTPYVFLLVSAALKQMNPALEEAGRVAGDSAIGVFFRITLPVISPAILAATLLCLVQGAEQFGIPVLLGVPSGHHVLTILIYNEVALWPPHRELASALSLVLLVLTMGGVFLQRRLLGARSFATISGKDAFPQLIALGGKKWFALAFVVAYILVTVVLPYAALVYSSLLRYLTTDLTTDLLTLANYQTLFQKYPSALTGLRNSFLYAAGAATIVAVMSTMLAFVIGRSALRVRHAVQYVTMIPLAIPGLVFAVGVLLAYIRPPFQLYGTAAILLVAYVTLQLPLGVQAATSALMQMHRELEESARVSGASWLRSLKDVVFPLIRPGLLAGWVLVFITVMRELSASILLYTPKTVVAGVVLWNMFEEGLFGHVSAYAVILVALVSVTLALFYRVLSGHTAVVKG